MSVVIIHPWATLPIAELSVDVLWGRQVIGGKPINFNYEPITIVIRKGRACDLV